MNARKGLAGAIIMAIGATFIGLTFVSNLFTVGPAFDEMTTDFRGQMTDANIATIRSDLGAMSAVSDEFQTKVVPTMATALKITPAEFTGLTEQQWPAVSTGVAALPAIGTRFAVVADTLDAEQTRFASAEAIPTTSLSASSVPWSLIVLGLGALLIGFFVFRSSRSAPTIAAIAGIALVVGSLMMSLPRKAADADTMNENLKPVYTASLIESGRASLATVTAMGAQMQDEMLPALGQRLSLDADGVSTFVGQNFPVTAAALQNLPAILARFTTTVDVFDQNLGNYNDVKEESFAPVAWTLLYGGALMFIAGLLAYGGAAMTSEESMRGIHARRKAA